MIHHLYQSGFSAYIDKLYGHGPHDDHVLYVNYMGFKIVIGDGITLVI